MIGGTLGAYWARAGRPVLVVGLVADHLCAISVEGLSIEGPVAEFRQTVGAVTPDTLKVCSSVSFRLCKRSTQPIPVSCHFFPVPENCCLP